MGEGEWNTEPVVPAALEAVEVEMAATPRPPSSPPSPRSTDPGVVGVSGYAPAALDAE